ncbi:MAG: segregation/condensation protein A, partial [Elusimicrobia bacterium]|nr:segregation/condensation protein A [Elusimicrobiota bacterium]
MNPKVYEVHLEMFEGPLDLLLYLIRKNDLDIQNIPLAQITREYLSYLDLMKELNLDVAGDFLVMAASLMQIKARSLLPSQEGEEGGPEGPDPRSELVSKLQEYQKFKEAAGFLQRRADAWSDVFYRGAPAFQEREKSLNIRIFDLLSTLREVLDRAEAEGRVVTGEEHPIEQKMEKILALLGERPYVTLREIFSGERRRRAIISCFLALLELVKLQRIFARQEGPFAEILIYKKEAPEDALPVWPGGEAPEPEPLPTPAPPLPEDTRPADPEAELDAEPAPAADPAPAAEPASEPAPERPSLDEGAWQDAGA